MKVSLGYPTRCATEWHLQRTSYWLGRAYIRKADGSLLVPFGPLCFNGSRLESLLRQAQVAVFLTEELTPDTIQAIIDFDDATVERAHASLGASRYYTKHQVYIDLRSPDLLAFEITIVDLPGKFSPTVSKGFHNVHLGIICNAEQHVVDFVKDITITEICKPTIILVAVRMCRKHAALL